MAREPIPTWYFVLVVVRRGPEVWQLFDYVARGGPVYPLQMLTAEGSPFVVYP